MNAEAREGRKFISSITIMIKITMIYLLSLRVLRGSNS